jgi:peroxiredoxin
MSSLPLRALAFVGISLVISACGGAAGPARGAGEVGKLAPALSIQSLNGKGPVSLDASSGKVAIVQFWATWCEPCKKSLTQLEQLSKQSAGKVDVIGISVDDTTRGVADFARAQGVTFPIAWDENRTLVWKWNVEKTPSTYILDGKGTVRYVHETKKDKDDGDLIAREVAELMSDGSVSSPKLEVASATVPVPPAPVPVPEAPAATSTDETAVPSPSETAPAAKPRAAKKGGAKRPATKKSAGPASKPTAS